MHNHLYKVKAAEIADAIENNQIRLVAICQKRWLVLDYGTRVITSVDAAAILMEEDYLKSSYVTDRQSSQFSITSLAGFNFYNRAKFDIGSEESQETFETWAYDSSITYSITLSHGGALIYPGITLQKKQESTLNNLIATDRSGLPLHYFLKPSTFPDLPLITVYKLALSVHKAIDRYYKINTYPDYSSPDVKPESKHQPYLWWCLPNIYTWDKYNLSKIRSEKSSHWHVYLSTSIHCYTIEIWSALLTLLNSAGRNALNGFLKIVLIFVKMSIMFTM